MVRFGAGFPRRPRSAHAANGDTAKRHTSTVRMSGHPEQGKAVPRFEAGPRWRTQRSLAPQFRERAAPDTRFPAAGKTPRRLASNSKREGPPNLQIPVSNRTISGGKTTPRKRESEIRRGVVRCKSFRTEGEEYTSVLQSKNDPCGPLRRAIHRSRQVVELCERLGLTSTERSSRSHC